MTPPKLAPSATYSLRKSVSAPRISPTNSDWIILYPEIERLYVRERRKLRYIMQYIELKYGLKATQQMYKKRFAKWGFQKNARRSANSTPASTTALDGDFSSSDDLCSVPVSPRFGSDDSLMLMLLTSVRTWNTSFYESAKYAKDCSVSIQHSWPERYHDMNSTFKLMIDMLNRGHGDLAGRVARKAFLLAEETLMLAGPALLWNMLEIMHYMMMSHHLQLFQLLLAHMKALVDLRMSKSHPLPTILRALSAFVASLPESISVNQNTESTSSSQHTPINARGQMVTTKTNVSHNIFLSIVEQAWKLNAEILFQNFNHHLFQLYLRVHWDTCSIEPPTAIIAATKQWIALASPQQISETTSVSDQSKYYVQITPFEEDRMLQSLLVAPDDSVLPEVHVDQQMNSIKMLHDHATAILSKENSLPKESSILLRILASLVTAKVLEEWSAMAHGPEMDERMTSMLSRGQAGNMACALRTQMYLNNHKHDTAEQIRFILALREYAKSGTDPRVVREMWLLEDVLVAAGEHNKASEVQQAALQRLEEYVEDVPLHHA